MRPLVPSRRWPVLSAEFATPKVRIVLRADSGFARDELMAWCETNGVHFVFGLAKNDRLIAEIKDELAAADKTSQRTGKPARRFKQFKWTTRTSWSRDAWPFGLVSSQRAGLRGGGCWCCSSQEVRFTSSRRAASWPAAVRQAVTRRASNRPSRVLVCPAPQPLPAR
jgi:hypothetical protein